MPLAMCQCRTVKARSSSRSSKWKQRFTAIVITTLSRSSCWCWMLNSDAGADDMTQSRLMSESLYWSVIKNLTLHRVKKIIFSLYHHKKQIRSFPTMYNTWGCSWGQIGEIIFFSPKKWLKTPILAAPVLDHPTSKWAGTHNFKDIANFHRCFKKFGT